LEKVQTEGWIGMGLANCRECGKLFVQNPSGICLECYRVEEENENKVAKFLRDNQRASISEVNEATGVPEKIILKMLKKGRIMGDVQVEYPCENCGKPILLGRVCQECSRRVLDQIKTETKASQPASPRASGQGLHIRLNRR
jgi:ribosomal protein L32